MAKFKIGDRVRSLEKDEFLNVGDIGTVAEEDDDIPYVEWDGKPYGALGYPQFEKLMELVKDEPHTENTSGSFTTYPNVTAERTEAKSLSEYSTEELIRELFNRIKN